MKKRLLAGALSAILAVSAVSFPAGTGFTAFSVNAEAAGTRYEKLKPPVARQEPGTYVCSGAKTIVLRLPQPDDGTLVCSVNGGRPQAVFNKPITITQNTVIECRTDPQSGKKFEVSDTVKYEYKLMPRVKFSSSAGKNNTFTVTAWSPVPGAKLYYTTDGSKPTAKSAVYKSPVKLKKGEKLRVLAVKENWTDAEYTYTPKKQGYFHTKGQQIIGPDGKPFIIKGINVMCDAFVRDIDRVLLEGEDHTEASYKEIAKLGFNSVKLCLNYQRFENDNAPYKYKDEGFDWLDNEIDMAKKYGLSVVLGNYVMPADGQEDGSQGRGLWNNAEHQKRTVALMTELAKRYANETAVIGYELLSEPNFDYGSAKSPADAVKQCKNIMQRIADGIRKYDKNHILFVDNILSVHSESGDMLFHDKDSLYTIKDSNVAYEFHSYAPNSFTGQGFYYEQNKDNLLFGEPGIYDVYPSEQLRYDKFDWNSKGNVPALEVGKADKNGWVKVETDFFEKTKDYNIGGLDLIAVNFAGGTIRFDDITVDEYDASGKKTRTVASFDFSDEKQQRYFIRWGEGGSVHISYDKKQGHNKKGSVYLKGAKDAVTASGLRFELKDGYKYKVSGYVKREKAGKDTWATLGVNFFKGEGLYTTNKEYLEHIFSVYLDFSKKNNVPIYLGEFGLTDTALKNGGDKWYADIFDLIAKYKINSNLHCYHADYYGLYSYPWKEPVASKYKNTALEAIIKKNLKKIK